MNRIEEELIENYVELEQLIKSTFDSNNGITEYLDRMSDNFDAGKNMIDGWEDTYKILRAIRHKRNAMMHVGKKSGASPKDVKFLKGLISAIKDKTDPVQSLYEKSGYIRRYDDEQIVSFSTLPSVEKKTSPLIVVIIAIALTAAVLGAIYFMKGV